MREKITIAGRNFKTIVFAEEGMIGERYVREQFDPASDRTAIRTL